MSKEKEAMAREETFREKRRDGKAHYVNRDIPNVGNTIYVHGIGLNEQVLKMGFSQFGPITNINSEYNKNCGFVTFETIDQANKAIDTMNGNQVNNITLKVSLARKQPFINKTQTAVASTTEPVAATQEPISPVNSQPTDNVWTSLASSYEQKLKTTKERRSLIAYDDIY